MTNTEKDKKSCICVFMDLEKAYNTVLRKKLWYCLRKAGLTEKSVSVTQDKDESSKAIVKLHEGE